MSVSDDLFDHLSTIALIGGPAAPRLYRHRLPAPIPTMPALTFFRVSSVFEYAHDGDNELVQARFQISCWATTNAGATALARAVQQRMDTWHATFGGSALPAGQYDLVEPDVDIYQAPIDYLIWYKP